MLHIQDSFSHTSSLLMSPPIAVVVQPQPSTSSRTNKVLEQLSSKYEAIQNEISTTKAQVKKRKERDRRIA